MYCSITPPALDWTVPSANVRVLPAANTKSRFIFKSAESAVKPIWMSTLPVVDCIVLSTNFNWPTCSWLAPLICNTPLFTVRLVSVRRVWSVILIVPGPTLMDFHLEALVPKT